MSILNRTLFSDNGVLTDITKEVNKYDTETYSVASFVASQDYLYIGSIAPFNHFYLKLSAVSAVASNIMSIQYWEGREWVNVYRTDDETKGLTQSGYVTFFPDKNNGWVSESTNDKGDSVTGLTTTNIYDMYWIRIKLSLDIPLGFSVSWIGQKFSNDDDLKAELPRLVRNSMLISFGATKTDWEEQHIRASELLIDDLIANQIIDQKGQVLVREEFMKACVYKVAQIIFTELGDDYIDQADRAEREYKKRLDKSIYRIDRNQDGLLNRDEQSARVGFMSR